MGTAAQTWANTGNSSFSDFKLARPPRKVGCGRRLLATRAAKGR